MELYGSKLLLKHDIPITHLDYGYLRDCKNPREVEKIIQILRSGEEGYYPDLTRFAEDKLRELNPKSRALWTEGQVLRQSALTSEEWKEFGEPVFNWTNEIKHKDKLLATAKETLKENTENGLPPVRQISKTDSSASVKDAKKSSSRIKSTDYQQWDKYDVETEELKIDLEEEKIVEEAERRKRINLKKYKNRNEITKEELEKLSDIEKQRLALSHKDRGNEYFKIDEFEDAIWEYTQSVQVYPTAAGFSNRALANLKVSKFYECIKDCDKSLSYEPKNLKALLRKAQAYLGLDKRRQAYDVYLRLIEIDPSNTIALKNMRDLKKQLPDLPPISATRIQIVDEEETSLSASCANNYNSKSFEEEDQQQSFFDDLSKLIIPNRIVKSQLEKTADQINSAFARKKLPTDRSLKTTRKEIISEISILSHSESNSGSRMTPFIEEMN